MSALRYRLYTKILLLVVIGLFYGSANAQHEADNWIFGYWAGLNFTSGDPAPFFPNPPPGGWNGTIMSDTAGNLLFYYGVHTVYNRNDQAMPNGTGLLPNYGDIQSDIAVPKPGTSDLYYVISVPHPSHPDRIYYSIVDMSLANGLGDVTAEKNIAVQGTENAQSQLCALKNTSGDGYWLITRFYNDTRYACFRIDASGFHTDPVYSTPARYRVSGTGGGNIKVSPDKKYLVATYWTNNTNSENNCLEICSFNAKTGQIEYKYGIARMWNEPSSYSDPSGCEFSPDSKYLYVSYVNINTWSGGALYQYNLQYVNDSAAFYNSGILIKENTGWEMQLSNDGRIYTGCLIDSCSPPFNYYMSVIRKPWESGLACDFDTLSLFLGGRQAEQRLPNIILDYLYRFEWEGDQCQGSPIHFIPNFNPTPDSVKWRFGELAPPSYDLSPTYSFQNPGTHEVQVDIWYPTGRFEHTSREIEIYPTPHPNLGPDQLICEGDSISLDANCTADLFVWNPGGPGGSQLTVSDSGTYIVSASFIQTGCDGKDTIHISFYPKVEIDISNLVITPSSCPGSNGSITGLNFQGSPPFTCLWQDLLGNVFGTDPDLFNLPAGQYRLTVTDANGCSALSEVYTITDAGDIQITDVQTTQPHCDHNDGIIEVTATSPSGVSPGIFHRLRK